MATATLPADTLPSSSCSATRPRPCSSIAARRCRSSLLHLPGPDFVDRVWAGTDRSNRVLRNLSSPLRPRPPRRNRVRLDPPCRPGHRALGGRLVRAQPRVLRPRKDRRARGRGWLQRGGVDLRRARRGLDALGAPDPVHRQAEPQRAAHLPERRRPDHVRDRAGGMEHRRGRGRRDHLLRVRRRRSPDPGGLASPSPRLTSSAWRPSSGATCATPRSRRTGSTIALAADLTGQANHLGVTIQADIIKQKLPTTNGGFTALNFGKTADAVYTKLTSDHPIDLCRYQVLNCYARDASG